MPVRKMLHLRKFFFGAATIIILYIILIYSRDTQIDDRDRKGTLAKIDQFIKSHVGSESCKFPVLPVNSSEIMIFFKNEPPVDCSSAEPDWVVVEGSICKISDFARQHYISITCIYTDLIRVDDYEYNTGEKITVTDQPYTLRKSDVVRVKCKSPHTTKTWKAILTGIRNDPSILERINWSNLPADALRLNVLMFGFDSLSRNTFIRKLPKSYKYLTEVLDSQVLQGYNIVGDGTPQALIPILTGQTELELPDTRKRISGTSTVDVYPFIWKEYKKFGYVTGFLEDTPFVGTFTYRLNGFKDPPTDHYMRPYYLASAPSWPHHPNLCYGSIPRHKIMMNHVKNFFSVYKDKPKFMFAFHGELSHDSYNLIGVADDDLLEFLMYLNNEGYLKDTLLIMMADHGHRFADIRNTVQGKQEERLPFFSFAFPASFKTEFKTAHVNFVNNKNVLTTPFDIYPTLKSVLSLGNTGPADLKQRSLSLFSQVCGYYCTYFCFASILAFAEYMARERQSNLFGINISEKRSCSDAYIEPHWCACLDWHEIPPDSPIIPKLTTTLLDALNNYTESHRHLCEKLSLRNIIWATQLSPNGNLLSFKKNADIDGFVADLSLKMDVNSNLYQIKAQLRPGNSLFEASITHYVNADKFELKMSDISRINMYGKQARCIENDFPHLRKYCYCKDSL